MARKTTTTASNGQAQAATTETLNDNIRDHGGRPLRTEEALVEHDNELKKGTKQTKSDRIAIAPLKQAIVTVPIVGQTPLKVLRFSAKKRGEVQSKQEAGDQAKTKTRRQAKDFAAEYEEAKYRCTQLIDGDKITWLGINASGVRNGCIETCRMAGFAMTRAKMAIFCIQDGYDDLDRTSLCRVYGDEEMSVDPVRNASGVIDLRPRVMFSEWRINVRLRFDEDQFSVSDVINLMIRVGQQNGLGEGRPNGTNGAGTGNGLFLCDTSKITLERMSMSPLVFTEE